MENTYKKYQKIANTKGISAIPEPYRTVIAIETVQSLLDNGGLEYLYENNFVDGFNIDTFSKSYNNIKCPKMANILSDSFARKEDKVSLQKYDNEIFQLSDSVWIKLDKYIKSSEELIKVW